jgi:hypothetical protein
VPIAFTCSCGASLSVPDSLSGKNGWCPTCGAILTVPVKEKKEKTLRFPCPGCKKTLRVPLRLAGTSGKCGSCGWVFKVGGDPEKLKEKLSGRQKKKASGRRPEPEPEPVLEEPDPVEAPSPMPDYFSSDDSSDDKVRDTDMQVRPDDNVTGTGMKVPSNDDPTDTDIRVRCVCGVTWAYVPGDVLAACPACGKPSPEGEG